MKVGLLLVAYGSASFKGTSALRNMQELASQRFSLPVRWAFTSETMRHRLACSKTKSDSVFKALSRMRFERFTHVAVQSLHIIPGGEYDAVESDCVYAAAQLGMRIETGSPLLIAPEGQASNPVHAAAQLLLRHVPTARTADEPVVYMAHGTRKECASLYATLASIVHALDPLVFVASMIKKRHEALLMHGSVMPNDELQTLLPLLQSCTAPGKQVWLLPMLSLVGRHAMEDMAGDSPASWKKRIEASGLLCSTELKGLADDNSFVSLWLDRVDASLKKLYAAT